MPDVNPNDETTSVTINGVVCPVRIVYFNDPDGTSHRVKYVETPNPNEVIYIGRWFGPQLL